MVVRATVSGYYGSVMCDADSLHVGDIYEKIYHRINYEFYKSLFP